jgi:hypothetical protein
MGNLDLFGSELCRSSFFEIFRKSYSGMSRKRTKFINAATSNEAFFVLRDVVSKSENAKQAYAMILIKFFWPRLRASSLGGARGLLEELSRVSDDRLSKMLTTLRNVVASHSDSLGNERPDSPRPPSTTSTPSTASLSSTASTALGKRKVGSY